MFYDLPMALSKAVGEKDDGTGYKSSAIHLYNSKTKGWTKIGDLTTALSWPLESWRCWEGAINDDQ